MVVAVVLMGPVQPPIDQIVDVIAVWHGLVSAAGTVSMRCIAGGGLGVLAGMLSVDRDHVLVHVLLVRVVQMAVVQVVDVIVVANRRVAAVRPVLMRVGALVDLVGHTVTLRRERSTGKGPHTTCGRIAKLDRRAWIRMVLPRLAQPRRTGDESC